MMKKLRYEQFDYMYSFHNSLPFCFLVAILKMAEFQVARDQNLMYVMRRTYGENFMLVSSTEVFSHQAAPLLQRMAFLNSSYHAPKTLFLSFN